MPIKYYPWVAGEKSLNSPEVEQVSSENTHELTDTNTHGIVSGKRMCFVGGSPKSRAFDRVEFSVITTMMIMTMMMILYILCVWVDDIPTLRSKWK